MTASLPRSSNPIERSFYDLTTRVDILGRTAKGRYDTTDPAVALKRIKEVRTALAAMEMVCRQDVKDRREAAKAAAEAEAARIAYETQVRRERGLLAPVVEPVEQPVREFAADGLVAMAKATAEDRALTATKTRPAGIGRLLGGLRRKAAVA